MMAVTKKEAQQFLRKGGQRVRQQATAEVYDREGPRLDRQTGAGMRTSVHQLLDPRLDVTATQRAVGNCFGAFYEQAMGGEGKEFLREYVDSTSTGGGGYSEAKVHKMMMVGCAAKALTAAPAFTYPVGAVRGSYVLGRHQQIKALALAQGVCVFQRTLSDMAIANGWTRIPVQNGKWGRPQVPDRQRKALAAALRTTLDTIADAWEAGGYRVPYQFMTVEVR
ncbi:hypothetical protein [Phaeobacter gallaeciensis]|uniref:hypothetical protein n=1 Tax=Phaeobacter gallaeciensis TaxID=60890 RepID=UPI00237F3BFB|nr:hypothetical protein [Phaeobacter gallaeciensis]MDE4189648.1 hypothetical protein [Phaeobacter gallaeciensis]MDE4198800.1 hypothetical protein [Phaeobacter gallaeciensis]MDE4202946.1 hypothetical protein [Phaeobacter gallaeciensis]MDE4207089.1 hypothetical protein [Phaeobacter gallaeciensis]MDE4215686.1 hypothetical protein [Phaeobacter gallaeciensis]